MSAHTAVVASALELMHVPYIYGGKSDQGLDCSGLVTLALWRGARIDLRATHDTDRMWNEWQPAEHPRCGDVALFGGRKLPDGSRDPSDVEHVMMVLNLDGDGPLLLIGACGGDRTTTTLTEAARRNAKVKVRIGTSYRDDFRGFRKLPID